MTSNRSHFTFPTIEFFNIIVRYPVMNVSFITSVFKTLEILLLLLLFNSKLHRRLHVITPSLWRLISYLFLS
jgi:hypothetical protein